MTPPQKVHDHELLYWAEELYKREPAGGALHLVLDDGNLETHHVAWCLWTAIEDGDERAKDIAYQLLLRSDIERAEWYWSMWHPNYPS